jgi:hypothetical protein
MGSLVFTGVFVEGVFMGSSDLLVGLFRHCVADRFGIARLAYAPA